MNNFVFRYIVISSLILALLFSFKGLVHNAMAGSFEVGVVNMAFAKKKVKSLKDLKFKNLIKQTKDYSCGAAALATIFTYYFDKQVTEEEVLESVIKKSNREKIQKVKKKGVSLLDLKRYGEGIGYKGAGYRVPAHLLRTLDRPAIALINYQGYSHFVVIKGFIDDKVFIADPAQGNITWGLEKFLATWNGVLLVFENTNGEKIQSHSLEAKSNLYNNKFGLLSRPDYFRFVIGPSEF
jgi:predicted double-glycine peptidase